MTSARGWRIRPATMRRSCVVTGARFSTEVGDAARKPKKSTLVLARSSNSRPLACQGGLFICADGESGVGRVAPRPRCDVVRQSINGITAKSAYEACSPDWPRYCHRHFRILDDGNFLHRRCDFGATCRESQHSTYVSCSSPATCRGAPANRSRSFCSSRGK